MQRVLATKDTQKDCLDTLRQWLALLYATGIRLAFPSLIFLVLVLGHCPAIVLAGVVHCAVLPVQGALGAM